MNKQKKNNLLIKKQKTKREKKRAQERWEMSFQAYTLVKSLRGVRIYVSSQYT